MTNNENLKEIHKIREPMSEVRVLPKKQKTISSDEKSNNPDEFGKFYSERDIINATRKFPMNEYKENNFNLKQQEIEDDDINNYNISTPEKKYKNTNETLTAVKNELSNEQAFMNERFKLKHENSIPHDTSIKPRKGDITPKDDSMLIQNSTDKFRHNTSSKIK